MPTQKETAFLNSQRIPESLVFHGGSLPKKIYKPIMEELGAILVTGTSPCQAAGHTIRTRAGHCAQCDTARIAFQRRYSSPGFVYVAVSTKQGLYKVGSSTDVVKRLKTLNHYGYGGATDWNLIDQVFSESAGELEFRVHAQLEQFRCPVGYQREGSWVECREIFKASASTILQALMVVGPCKP
jgi:hypothetical protein